MRTLWIWLQTQGPERSWKTRLWTALTAGAALFAVYAVLEWPGTFTADSMLMAWQANGDAPVTTYHPVSVVAVYRFAIAIFGAPGPWIIQAALMCIAFGAIWTLGRPSRLRRLLAILLFLSPPWIAMTATVGKDALAAALVVLLAAVVFTRPAGRIAGPAALAAAVSLPLVRFNAFPLCALAVVVWPVSTIRVRTIWRATAAVLVGLLLSAGTQIASVPVAEYTIDTAGTFQAWDLAGIATRTGSAAVIPQANRRPARPCTTDEIRDQYTPESSDALIFPDGACIVITKPEDYAQLEARKEAGFDALAVGWRPWLGAVWANRGAYIRHRLSVSSNLLGVSGFNQVMTAETQHSGITLLGGSTDYAPGHSVTEAQLAWTSVHLNVLWAPWIAILVLAAALAALMRVPEMRSRAALIGATAGVFVIVTLLTVPGTDTRYMYPVVALAGVALVMALVQLASGGRAAGSDDGVAAPGGPQRP